MELTNDRIKELFCTSPNGNIFSDIDLIKEKLRKTKILLFDWDGVFNDGKNLGEGSIFSEVDSMAVNMLRFYIYLLNKEVPFSAIITGSKNMPAIQFARRECFDSVYLNAKNKAVVLKEILLENPTLKKEEITFFFDDILDLPIAKKAGLSMMIGCESRPLWHEYIIENKIADYISSSNGGNFGIRESIEFLLAVSGRFREIVEKREKFTGDYENYLILRNKTITKEKIL